MNLQFQTPWLLYLLWVIPLLAALWTFLQRRANRAVDALISPLMQSKLRPATSTARAFWQIALAGGGSLLLLLAAAGPRWGEREERVLQMSRDLVIAIDVSLSMLANDVHPSRLERAKADAIDLISSLKGDRAALVAFRNKATLVCPLTSDQTFLRQALAGISPDSAPRGETDIGGAILKALDAFNDTSSSHKAIILISDGEDLSGEAIDAAKTAGSRGIPIYTIGIGSRRGSTIPDFNNPGEAIRFENKPVITRLDDESLLTIARLSGGSYVPVETAGTATTTLGSLYRDHLRRISRKEMTEAYRRRAIERYQWFLLPAFLLLCAVSILSRGRLAVTAILLLFCSYAASASPTDAEQSQPPLPENTIGTQPTGHQAARAAQRHYREGEFDEAAALYRAAAIDSDHDTARTFRFNEAAALAAAGRYREAADLLRTLTLQGNQGDPDAAPALGSVLYQQAEMMDEPSAEIAKNKAESLRQAAEAFKEAWRNAPDSDARHDLALSLRTLPAAQEQAKALKLAEQYQDTPAPAIAAEMLASQRKINKTILSASDQPLPELINTFEKLAEQQRENADRWMPLRHKLSEALQQQADINDDTSMAAIRSLHALMDVTQQNMHQSRLFLRDVDTEAFRPAKLAEQGTYQLWKTVAPYEMLLQEGIDQQEDTIDQIEKRTPPDPTLTTAEKQIESAELTDLFKSRFENAVPPEGTVGEQGITPEDQDAEPSGITPQVRARILDLAQQAAGLQRNAADAIIRKDSRDAILPVQTAAMEKLREIADLLPKPPPESSSTDPQDQPQNDQQESPPPEATSQGEPAGEPPQQQDAEQQQPEEPQTDDDVQAILQRALEREREHEEEKRQRQRRIQLPHSARDW